MEKNFRLALKKSQSVILTFENDQKLGKKNMTQKIFVDLATAFDEIY